MMTRCEDWWIRCHPKYKQASAELRDALIRTRDVPWDEDPTKYSKACEPFYVEVRQKTEALHRLHAALETEYEKAMRAESE